MAATTFYFVETNTEEQPITVCQWVEHFYEQGRRIQIIASSSVAAQRLDHLLWTFAQPSFIPHRIGLPDQPSVAVEAVIITAGEELVQGTTVLVCDGSVGLEFMQRYEEVVHFVLLDDPEKRQESRSLWQAVRDKGARINHIPYASRGKHFSSAPK